MNLSYLAIYLWANLVHNGPHKINKGLEMNQIKIRLDKHEEIVSKFKALMEDKNWSAQKLGEHILLQYFGDSKPVKPKTTKPTVKRFIKPTWEELANYFHEQQSMTCQDDATAFIDHYTANGWKIGKNQTPMKNWKASVRTWMRGRKQNEQGNGKRSNQGVEAGHAAISSSEF